MPTMRIIRGRVALAAFLFTMAAGILLLGAYHHTLNHRDVIMSIILFGFGMTSLRLIKRPTA
jgi:hypothetical protein